GAHAVMIFPDLDIVLDGYPFPVRPRKRIEIGDQSARRSMRDRTIRAPEDDAVHALERRLARGAQRREELLHGYLALALHDGMRAGLQVLSSIGRWFRTSQNDGPSRSTGAPGQLQNIPAGHEISVNPYHRRRTGLENREQILTRPKRRIEDLHFESLFSEMRGKIENPQ